MVYIAKDILLEGTVAVKVVRIETINIRADG
jgi:hypothetical protein